MVPNSRHCSLDVGVIPETGKAWDRFIDIITVVWLSVFIAGFFASLGESSQIFLLSVLPIYVADLGVKYSRVRNVKLFLRGHWLSILMVIPYFRVLRLLKFARLLRFLRVIRIGKFGRWPGSMKVTGAYRRVMRLKRRAGI